MLSPYSPLSHLSRSEGVVIDSATSRFTEGEDDNNNCSIYDDASALEGNVGLTVLLPWRFHTMMMLVLFANMAILRVPAVANTLRNLLRAVPNLDPSHKIEPLSVLDWLMHLPLMPLGLELCSILWRSSSRDGGGDDGNSVNISKHMAIIFGFNLIQGFLTNMNHSLVNVNTDLQNKLWSLSQWALRSSIFMAGVVIWIPNKWGWGLSTLIGYGIWTQSVSFENMAGRILATSALIAVLAQKTSCFSTQFKASYALLALAPVVVPNPITDKAHLLGAAYVTCALMLLVSSARKMMGTKKKIVSEQIYATITRARGGLIIDVET